MYHIGSLEELYQGLQLSQVHPSFWTPSRFFRTLTSLQPALGVPVVWIPAQYDWESNWPGIHYNRDIKQNDEQKVRISNTVWKTFLWIVEINLSQADINGIVHVRKDSNWSERIAKVDSYDW